MKRIGIMGGTFNPIHKGHLALAKAAMEEFVLDKVIFIPAGMPPHKKPGEVIDKEHRYNMVKMAIKRIPKFSISRIEVDRKGISYAVDTFNELKKYMVTKPNFFISWDWMPSTKSWNGESRLSFLNSLNLS